MKEVKDIKDIAEEALGKGKAPKGVTTITIDIIGKGKPGKGELKGVDGIKDLLKGLPFGFEPEREEEENDLAASIRGVIETLEGILAKCENKAEPKEAEEVEVEED